MLAAGDSSEAMIKDLHRMAIFANVVEQASFSKAAEHLGLGKSIVSAHVSSLEKRLGVKLINRSTRALALTSEGRAFYDHCRQMVAAADSALATVQSQGTEAGGVIRMTASYNLGVSFLIPQLAVYRELHPGVLLDVVLEDSISSVIGERFDLALRVGQLADAGLFATEIGRCSMLLCAAPEFIESRPAIASPDDLLRQPWVSITQLPHSERVTLVHRLSGETVSVRLKASIKTHSGIGAREFIRCAAGVGLLPDYAVAEDIRLGALVQLLPDWHEEFDRPISVIFPTRDLLPTRVRLLIDYLRTAFAARIPSKPHHARHRSRPG